MNLTNPFTDQDFAETQLQAGKASKIHKLDDQIVYQYQFNKKLSMLHTNSTNPDLQKIAKQENAIFTLIENYKATKQNPKKFFREITPRHTLIIDLSKSEDEILKDMHQKGRYNIRLAEKKGLTIKEEKTSNNFYKILEATGKRDGFYINPQKHYEAFLNVLGKKNKAKLFMAYLNDEPIAGILNTYIGNTATYFYGASSNKHRNLMAPYLLQWHAIKEAKKRGFKYYDFLGIADPQKPKDPLKGVTQFKTKFGGEHIKWKQSKVIVHKPLHYFGLKLKRLLSSTSI
jgi:lipid II:glycine glycyltransferase (peptidoglycan interpeptide bridge formation enzyme)